MAAVKKLISLDSGVARELETVAEALKMTQREVVERALDFYFDYTDAAVAQKISRQIEEGKQQVHDAEEVFASMGL
jgi:predicted transcriptional regulator